MRSACRAEVLRVVNLISTVSLPAALRPNMSKDNTPDFDIQDGNAKDPAVAVATGASDNVPITVTQKITRISSILTVLVSGLGMCRLPPMLREHGSR